MPTHEAISRDTTARIAKLSNREADRWLVEAEQARLAEIDQFWALCRSHPASAMAHAGNNAFPRDVFLLATHAVQVPLPASVSSLAAITEQLLAEPAVRLGFLDADEAPEPAELVNAFWQDGTVVAVQARGGLLDLVVRYDGPLFNPQTVPETCLVGGASCYLVCQQEDDPVAGKFESLTAYVFASVAEDGTWRDANPGLEQRATFMRDLPATERLVDRNKLSDEYFDVRPLTSFPTSHDRLIAQLKAQKATLRAGGAVPPDQQALVDQRTAPLHAYAEQLRVRMREIETELNEVRCQIIEVEACALEEATGISRGDTMRHRITGQQGVLEIVNVGIAKFRLRDTTMYVTEEIRRGEWVKVPAPAQPVSEGNTPD